MSCIPSSIISHFSRISLREATVLKSKICTKYLGEMTLSMGSPAFIHTGNISSAWYKPSGPKNWPAHNIKVYPPQEASEERRPAFVCHMRENIKYSTKKMWYIACLVRGMSVDEAVKQLSFIVKKGAQPVMETILEAQELAVRDHNVEFKSNLWVAESFVGKGQVIKGMRRHARKRAGMVHYRHCHYFVRLEEGKPPAHYYPQPKTGEEMLEAWLTEMRQRRIIHSL